MKLSIIIPVLESYGALKRQIRYLRSLDLPDDIEIIIVDDGSDPPLKSKKNYVKNLTILETHDTRRWTQGLARNMGAEYATGEYLLMTDIDHILSKEAIDAVYRFTGFKMVFPRYIAVLDIRGRLRQDLGILKAYGFDEKRLPTRGLYASVHGNTFGMKRSLFWDLGGYPPNRCQYGFHAGKKQGEDCFFNKTFNRYAAINHIKADVGLPIYIFPIGRYNINGNTNPMGLFHRLSYEKEIK